MKLPPLNLEPIAKTRKVRSDTELEQFALKDQTDIATAAARWVREVATQKLSEIIAAGNPPNYALDIDGATHGSGKVKKGQAFRAGSIANAQRSVRASFVGGDLAVIANKVKPRLLKLIKETFPHSQTKRLERDWIWWIQREALVRGKSTRATPVGASVPTDVGLYDVLWLAPQGKFPARYAWYANAQATGSETRWNMVRRKGKAARVRKRVRGFMAEATRTMRGTKSQQAVGPLNIQAMFIKDYLTGGWAHSRYGVPVIRIAFRKGLAHAVRP